MDDIARAREEEAKKIKSILEPQERILIAFPYGRRIFDSGWRQSDELQFHDNLVITNKRVLIIPKEWFSGKKTYILIPYIYITGIDLKEQVMGTTLQIKVSTPSGESEYILENCPKKGGEEAADFLQKMKGKLLCDACLKQVREEFVFCPHCKHTLKRVCKICNRALESEWLICPFCGK